jgi:predicted dehydrogenase
VNSQARIGVGIVGLGFGRTVHLPAYRLFADAGVEVVAVCSRNEQQAAEVARAEGIRSYGDWQRLIDDPEIDLVSIATPPGAHAAPALAALQAGKAVLCEKPLALDDVEAEQLVIAAERSRTPAAVNFAYRAVPAFRAAHSALSDGAIGVPLVAEVSWCVNARVGLDAAPSWKDDAAAGGGALASYGAHVLDYIVWLLGPVSRVDARLSENRRAGTVSDDSCTLLLDHATGVRSTVFVSLIAPQRMHRVVIRGEAGQLVIENLDPLDHIRPFSARIEVDGNPPQGLPLIPAGLTAPPDVDGRIEPLAVHIAEVVRALRGGPCTAPSFADGFAAQRLLSAARRSAVSGSWGGLEPSDQPQ